MLLNGYYAKLQGELCQIIAPGSYDSKSRQKSYQWSHVHMKIYFLTHDDNETETMYTLVYSHLTCFFEYNGCFNYVVKAFYWNNLNNIVILDSREAFL